MTEITAAAESFLGGMPRDTQVVFKFFRVLKELEDFGCVGIAEKIREYGPNPMKIANLLAELRMGLALSKHIRFPACFRIGSTPDLRFDLDGFAISVEVQHKAAADASVSVFLPGPSRLEGYAGAPENWKRASKRLHDILGKLPVTVDVRLAGELREPRWEREHLGEQETECGELATWLADELSRDSTSRKLTHPSRKAEFLVSVTTAMPGRIKSLGSLQAFILREYPTAENGPRTLSELVSQAVERKAAQFNASEHYVVGLVIDEPFAHQGHVLVNTLLGPLVHDSYEERSYRAVPQRADALAKLDAASNLQSRREILSKAQYDSTKTVNDRDGLFFDDSCKGVVGVLALYYTHALHFVPNPFSNNEIESVCNLFPSTLSPFSSLS